MFEKCQYKWNFIPSQKKENGYQSLISQLEIPQPQVFKKLSTLQKQQIVDNLIKKIRTINIFPIFYFNEEGIKEEILSVINKNNVCFNEEDNLQTYAAQGVLLLDYLFPNLHHIKAGYSNNPSMYQIFYDDEKLKRCFIYYLSRRKICNLRTSALLSARYLWNAGTNFSPIRAKAIYERFCPKNGVIYDYCAGFGGRMLGALSSNNNYTYIAVEPNSDTYYNLLQLGQYIENVTNRKNSFFIQKIGSETFVPKEKIDFAFSCPPFFDLEKYSNQPTQSIIKYPDYNDWLEFYVRPTIKNCYNSLKDEGIYGVDLMNYSRHSKKIYLIEDWLKIAEQEGFYLRKICKIITRARKVNDSDKQQLLIFTKDPNILIKNETPQQTINEYKKRKIKDIQRKNLLKQKTFCRYNFYGKLQKVYNSLEAMAQDSKYSIEEVKKAIKSKKRYNQYIFKIYKNNEDILDTINCKKVICKINNKIFDSFSEAGRELNVSRQAVQQSYKRKSKRINNIDIQWL